MRRGLLVGSVKARRSSGLWGVGFLVAAVAGGAWAGPTTTLGGSTTTTTTTGGSTTTSTTEVTTTTVPTTTTTAVPTTTTTAVPTTTTTTSTTTTIPTSLSGQFPFVDQKIQDANQSFLNIDTGTELFCASGQVRFMDVTTTLNRRVTISYSTIGLITRATEKKVDGFFETVDLTLDITAPRAVNNGGPINYFNATITLDCTGRISFKQPDGLEGLAMQERALDRITLECEVGPDFELFAESDILGRPLTPSLLGNVTEAYEDRKGIKADVRTGKIKITTSGIGVLPEDDRNIPLTCDFPEEE